MPEVLSPSIIRELPDGRSACYIWFSAMHTRVDLLLIREVWQRGELTDLIRRVRMLVGAIEGEGNCFDPSSLLSRFNRLPIGETMDGGSYLYEIMTLCQRYHAQTEGVFDVTVDSEEHSPDSIRSIDLSAVGCLRRLDSRTRVNLSGFIKGYALDRIGAMICDAGLKDVVVNMGNSSIMAVGDVPLKLQRRCVTTSGNTPGQPCQIIDPRTNIIVPRAGVVQVSTDCAAEGEVLATSFFVAVPGSTDEEMLHSRFPQAIVSVKP